MNGFSAYSFDSWLVFLDAAKRAMATAKPGTPEFRTALRNAIFSTKDLVGTHAIYNFKPGDKIRLKPDPRLVHLFDAPTGKRLNT